MAIAPEKFAVGFDPPSAARTDLRGSSLRPLRGLAMWSWDVLLLAAGWFVAIALHTLFLPKLRFAPGAVPMYGLCGLCWMASLFYERIYSSGLHVADQTDQIVKALTGGLVAAILVSFAGHSSGTLSRGLLVGWYGANLAFFILLRPYGLRWAQRAARTESVLVVADHPRDAEALVLALQRAGHRCRCVPLDSDPEIIRITGAAAVTICLPETGADHIVARWEQYCGSLGVIPCRPLSPLGARAVNLHGVQLFTLEHPLDRGLNRAIKRSFDLAGATALMLLLAPLALLLAILIRLDSRGPVLFRQTRLGRGGQVIRVLKFRSMAVDADLRLREILARDPLARQEFEATHKLKHDPRVTRVGNWLRRYSLDELPQLWNVWRGHMSLVGPRPIVAAEIPKYAESYPIVSSVRPGLTGVWQTSGRSDVSYESRRRFDVGYVRDWSLWRDIAILLRTVAAVVSPQAY